MELFDMLPNSQTFQMVWLPLLIFLARVSDVTLGTLRIAFLARGWRGLAPILGFFEVLIWIVAISQIMQNVTNIPAYFAYAAGFAAGNYLGLWIENKLALGTIAVQTVTSQGADEVVRHLHDQGYGVTKLQGQGSMGTVDFIVSIIKRKDLSSVLQTIREINPKAFVSVEEIHSVSEGIFPRSRGWLQSALWTLRRK